MHRHLKGKGGQILREPHKQLRGRCQPCGVGHRYERHITQTLLLARIQALATCSATCLSAGSGTADRSWLKFFAGKAG